MMIQNSYYNFSNISYCVFSFQWNLNHLNQTSQSNIMIVLSENTFENHDFEFVLMTDLLSDASLKFWPFQVQKVFLWYYNMSSLQCHGSDKNLMCQVKVMITFPILANFCPFLERKFLWHAKYPIFMIRL
jgi:hypothetical protein